MKKQILGTMCLMLSACAWADDAVTTLLVTDSGEKAAVENVDFLLAADNDEDFQVILKEGNPILNVKRVTFEQGQGGITEAAADPETALKLVGSISSTLTLTGCAEGSGISIFSENGILVKSAVASQVTTLDVSSLASGCYILRAGNSCLKFIKK